MEVNGGGSLVEVFGWRLLSGGQWNGILMYRSVEGESQLELNGMRNGGWFSSGGQLRGFSNGGQLRGFSSGGQLRGFSSGGQWRELTCGQ